MNEFIFVSHIVIVFLFLNISFYFGKEAIFTYVASSWLFANFFVSKQIILFGLEVTASDVYAIGALLGVSLLQEYWGRKEAQKAIWMSFVIVLFAVVASFVHLNYVPSQQDVSQEKYASLLSPQLRLFCASIASFFISQFFELWLFRVLQEKSTLPFYARGPLVQVCVQFIDTVVFSVLGLWMLVHSLWDVVIMSYTIKLVIALSTIPFLAFLDWLLPNRWPKFSTSKTTLQHV